MDRKYLKIGLIALVVLVISIAGCVKQDNKSDEPIKDEIKPIDQETPKAGQEPIQTEPETLLDDSGATAKGISSVVDANNQFTFDFYSNLKDKEDGNIFFSPYSISTALAMTYEGARGQTAKEIQSVFNFPEDSSARRPNFAAVYNQLNKRDAKYKINTANALWVQEDFQLLDDYTNTIEAYYGGKATNVDFAGATEQARKTINTWVENKTNNKIKDLFPAGSLDPSTRLVLTNAIYFKGTWVKQFNENDTKDEDFRVSSDKTVKVPMMRLTGTDVIFNYSETEDLQMLEMPYEGEDLSMLILLPKNDDIAALEESLTAENLNEWKSQLVEKRLNVFMPKFTFNTKYFLKKNLEEMGMPSAFSETNADFSGIDGKKDLFIQIVVHQAFVEINEEGTEAAAATGVGFGITSMPQIETFRADHPFVFIIQQKETGNILFVGRVIDPTI